MFMSSINILASLAIKVRGRVVQGLVNRRADEQKEFFRNG